MKQYEIRSSRAYYLKASPKVRMGWEWITNWKRSNSLNKIYKKIQDTRRFNMNHEKRMLSPEQHEEILRTLKVRFEKNMNRHQGLEWAKVQTKLEVNDEKLWSHLL